VRGKGRRFTTNKNEVKIDIDINSKSSVFLSQRGKDWRLALFS